MVGEDKETRLFKRTLSLCFDTELPRVAVTLMVSRFDERREQKKHASLNFSPSCALIGGFSFSCVAKDVRDFF